MTILRSNSELSDRCRDARVRLSEIVRQGRASVGMSLTELAEATGVGRYMIWRMEHATGAPPDLAGMVRLIDAMKIPKNKHVSVLFDAWAAGGVQPEQMPYRAVRSVAEAMLDAARRA